MKVGLKKLLIWALVVSSLLGVVAGSQVTAIKTSDALEKMKEAGKIQLVTNVMSKCVKQRINDPYNPNTGGLAENSKPYSPTADPFAQLKVSIPSGSWLENQIQGKVNNGTIDCQDNNSNIINVFASTLGIDKNAVFCDGKKPGILKLQNQGNNGQWYDVENECAAGIGNNNLRFVFNDEGAMAHVEKLYKAQKQKNQYLVSWGDRGTFEDNLINYFLYFNDFTTSCSSGSPYSGDESLLNKSKYFGPIKVPNPSTGKMEERYYPNSNVVKDNWYSNWINGAGAHTCDSVIKRINETAPAVQKALNATEKDEDGTKPDDIVGDITNDAAGNNGEEASPCSQAASSLGWIICPVVQMIGEAAEGIYGYIENNYLKTNPQVIDDSGTREAWGVFRDFANVAFVITLLIIILSQITGFGVSNYGIKKMLPSLIIVAVLVNVSFFLCEFAVDLSNIVGYGVKQIFIDLGSAVAGGGQGDASLGAMVKAITMTFIGGGGTIIGLTVAYNMIEFWILPLVLLLITALFAIFFFFILLGVRQAGIIILVTLAPMAIVCYALPNTKNIFVRWRKMFFALLLVYPICGALMGGGQFASRLLLRAGSSASGDDGMRFSYAFVAILIQSVPLFFVPSILKSSMSAMGNLGMKISNFGRGLSRGTTGAIRKSEGYRDAQARLGGHQAQRMLNRADWNQRHKFLGAPGRLKNRAGEKIRSGNGRLADMARNSYSRRQSRLQDAVTEQNLKNARAKYMSDGNFDQRMKNRLEAEHERYIDGMADDIEAANSNIATDTNELQKRHAAAIVALNEDPTSDQNIAVMRAYQNMLNGNGDFGRSKIFDNYAQDYNDHSNTLQTGAQMAARHLISKHGKDVKASSRDLFHLANDMDKGEIKGTFKQFDAKPESARAQAEANGEEYTPEMRWMSSTYGAKSVGGYDAASFARADESSIDRLIAQARSGQFDAGQQTQLEEYTRKALDGQHNIHVQGKVADKMNQLREAMGYVRVTQGNNTDSGDSGSITIPRSNRRAGSDTQQDIIRNPDGTIQGQIGTRDGGKVRHGSTMTDSGIIIPPQN